MNPGARSVLMTADRLIPAALAVLVMAIVLVGLLIAVLAAPGPAMEGAPAGDLLLGPYRWSTLAERGLA